MRNQIKLYSFSLPLAIVPVLAFSFDQIGPYLKGMEFRAFIASVISQLISGTVDAFITAGVVQLFAG
jgi:hypothetical protein